jgi:hypothetical protein
MTRFALYAAPLALFACSSTSDDHLGLTSTRLAVATSIFNADFTGSGTLNTVDIATRVPKVGIDATLDADTKMKVVGDELFVLEGDTGSVRIYDPTTFAVKVELPVGDTDHPSAKAYPHDLWVADDGKIWVTLSGNDAAHSLVVLDRNAPGSLVYIGLPQDPSDTDGKPEPDRIYACEDKIYVTLQSYSFDSNFSISYAKGRLAIVDPSARTVRGVIALSGENPFDISQISDDCNDVVVANAAGLTTEADGRGNLERVDLGAGATKGVLTSDLDLGGRPTLLARASDALLYVALYFDPQQNAQGATYLSSVKVVAYDPQQKKVLNDVSGKLGNVNFLRVFDGQVFFGAGVFAGMEAPGKAPRGLYIGPADGKMVTTPIDLGLTPSSIGLP